MNKKQTTTTILLILLISLSILTTMQYIPTVCANSILVLVDSYSEGNWSTYMYIKVLHPSTNYSFPSAFGQSFQVLSSADCNITSVKFLLAKIGSPTGMAHAKLYTHSGTYGSNSTPTGDALATSDDFDVSTLGAMELETFTFSGSQQYPMSVGQYYVIVFEAPTTGTIDTNNYIYWFFDYTSPTHGGNQAEYGSVDVGVWVPYGDPPYDTIFYVYGILPSLSITSLPTSVDFNLNITNLVDSYSEGNYSIFYPMNVLHPSSTFAYSATLQCFQTSTVVCKITSAKFYLGKYGSPTGNAHAVLYAMTGTYGTDGKPTGDALATSDDFDVSTLGAMELETFTFSGSQRYELQPSTYYCIAYENPTAGTINGDNFPVVCGDNTSPTHGGNFAYFMNSVWSAVSGEDGIFYVYGIVTHTTPYSEYLEFGTYQINFTSSFVRSGVTWTFGYWNDNTTNTNPNRTIDFQADASYSVTYTSIYITFYKNDGVFSVNGTSISNGTTIFYHFGTVLTLEASGWTKYYWFGNFTFSYGGSSKSNPCSHTITHDANYSIWLYNKWSPQSYPPDFPSTPQLFQYLVNGDYLGFIHGYFTNIMGETFYAFIMLVAYVGLYLRLKTIVVPIIAWTLMGGFWIVMAPSISPFVALFWIIGIAGGVLFAVFGKGSEN